MSTRYHTGQKGFTLIEIIVTIVIIGLTVATFMFLVSDTVSRSADPLFQTQSSAIAHSYLEEIMSKSYSSGPGTGSRAMFDDVLDYNGLVDVGARDINGNAIPGLSRYTVSITVSDVSINGQAMREIAATVTDPGNSAFTMNAYRGNL
jgi:MSHA pilin protein MshD